MFHTPSALLALGAVVLLMVVAWATSLRDGDASVLDPLWGPAIWLVGLVHGLGAPTALAGARLLALVLVGAWALRLAWHLARRHAALGEDRRYRKMREGHGDAWWWRSLTNVFLVQAVLAWIVALPWMAAGTGKEGFGPLVVAGALVALVGLVWEALADAQLAVFRRTRDAAPEGERPVLDTGLWRFSRHPNYFGEFVFWWGIAAMGVAAGAWWCLFGAGLLSLLLMKVSGVTMTEADIAERRPAYRDYVRRTNAFFPGPRRVAAE